MLDRCAAVGEAGCVSETAQSSSSEMSGRAPNTCRRRPVAFTNVSSVRIASSVLSSFASLRGGGDLEG